MERKDIGYFQNRKANIENELRYFVSVENVKDWIKATRIPLIKENYKQILEAANKQMTEYAHATYLELIKELNRIEESFQPYLYNVDNIKNNSIGNALVGGAACAVGAAIVLGGPVIWVAGVIGAVAGLFFNSKRMEKELVERILNNQNEVVRVYKEKCIHIISSIINVWTHSQRKDNKKTQRIDKKTSPAQEKIVDKTNNIGEKLSISQEKIKIFLERRNIKYLIHFTDSRNVESINKNGILSVHEMELRGIKYYSNDPNRFDKQPDYISLSISKHNNYLLDKYKENGSMNKTSFIIIDSAILYKEINTHRIYCQTNAATKTGKKGDTFDDLKKLFADKVEYSTSSGEERTWERNYNSKPYEPTDSQAEILFQKRIDPKYFIKDYNDKI